MEMINKVFEFIANYNTEELPYTNLDCDGNSEPDMGKFAEEVKQFMLNHVEYLECH